MLNWIAGMLQRWQNGFAKKYYTARFVELWQKNSWTFEEYFYCHNAYHDALASRGVKYTFIMICSLIAAGISFFNEAFFLFSLFILIVLHAYFKSSQHMLVIEVMQTNLMLARLQNNSDKSMGSEAD